MSADIELRHVVDFAAGPLFDIVNRTTGEILDPDDPNVQALALEACKLEQARLAQFKRALDQRLVEHTQLVGERTTTLPGGVRVVREGGPVKEYDAYAVARGLREAGMPQEAIARIVERVTTIRVNGREAQKAARANPRYRDVIDAATRTVDRPYTIKLG